MKLSTYASSLGISYKTAWRMWKSGTLSATQLPTGTIIVHPPTTPTKNAVIYTRVSSSQNKSNLDTQVERLESYCLSKGYSIVKIIKEVGSGVNDHRRKFIDLLNSDNYDIIVVEHKDRLTRVGFNYLDVLLSKQGKSIDVVNICTERTDDLMQDFVSIITSFCARLYSIRRRTRKSCQIVNIINSDETNSTT
jgi:predicted site-specific integrase-resolvase